jgi:mono/diheme cytochrome c family protein
MFTRNVLKRALLWTGILLAVAFLAIQAVPYGRGHSNPPVQAEPSWDTPGTRELAVQQCFDCHSNETKWPWYSNIAPVSWWLYGHVKDGREVLNFSEWDRPQESEDAAESVAEGEMPPGYYKPWDRMSAQEKHALVQGLTASLGGEAGQGETIGAESEEGDD